MIQNGAALHENSTKFSTKLLGNANMASITEYKGKRGTTYRVEVNKHGQRITGTFDRRSDAVRYGEDVEYALDNGLPLPGEDIPIDDKRIDKAVDEYLLLMRQDRDRSKHTMRVDNDTGNRLVKAFGKISLRGLEREDIEQHITSRLRIVGHATVRQDMSMLSKIYKTARIEWRMKNLTYPGESIPMPSPPPSRKKIVPEMRFGALLEECEKSKNKTLYPLVCLMLSTGMRPEEAVLMRWQQVLWDEDIIDLTKTKTEPRRVPLPTDCKKILKQLQGKPHELIFISEETAAKSQPVRFFRRSFEQACIRSGINRPAKRDVSRKQQEEWQENGKAARVTLYTLRHSAATYLLQSGNDLETVRDLLGHSDISQTSRYTHLTDEHKKNAVNDPNLPWKRNK